MVKIFDTYEDVISYLMFDDEELEHVIKCDWYDENNIHHIFIIKKELGIENIPNVFFMAEILEKNNKYLILYYFYS